MEPETQAVVAKNVEQATQPGNPQATQQATEQATEQVVQEAAPHMPISLQPEWALVFLASAMLLSLGISRLARLPGLRGVRHWLLLGRVLVWAVVIFDLVFAVSYVVTPQYWLLLGVLVLGVMSAASLDWLRNVVAGLAIEFEGSFKPGDVVRHGDTEGELAEFGTRAVMLRADDGTLHQIPNEKFTGDSVTHLELDGEAACEIIISLPRGVSPTRVVNLAQQAAFLTPLASPNHRPDVFLDVGEAGSETVELRIRGYAFDPAYRAHFRSDVVARVHDLLRTERAAKS